MERRVRRITAVAFAASMALAAGGFLAFGGAFWARSSSSGELRRLAARLAQTPCDPSRAAALAEALMDAGDARGAIDRDQSFAKQCGRSPRLARINYAAHMRLAEFDRAISDGDELVEDAPNDKDFRWWRGMAYESRGNLEAAAADYRSAIAIQPRLQNIPFNLADIYEKLGRPCDALFPLEQFLHYYPATGNDDRLPRRIERLYQTGGCHWLAGSGHAVIHFDPAAPAIAADVLVNGTARGRFVVDTGASYVALSRSFADRLGIASSDNRVVITTAAGARSVELATVDSLEVQGAKADHVAVTIADDLAGDGLLGLSFLSRFAVKLDPASGTLELTARTSKPSKQ